MRLLVFCFSLLLSTLSLAQSPVDLNAEFFRPSVGEGFFAIEGAKLLPNLHYKGDALFNFSDGSLVAFDNNGNVLLVPIENQAVLDLGFSLGLFDFAEFGVAFPLAVNQTGQDLTQIGGVGAVSGSAAGDLRLSGKARLIGKAKQETGVFVAFAPELSLPTGSGGEFFGGASAAAKLAINAEWRTKKLALGANVGPRFQQRVELQEVISGNELDFGAGASFKVHHLLTTLVELDGAQSLEVGGESPLEARGGIKITLPKGLKIPIGAGFGLNQEVGAPNFRVFAGLSFSPDDSLKDTDEDGIVDTDDKCIKEPEDKDNFEDKDGCPELDNDEDKIADKVDACPLVFGPAETEGCPDQDADTIADKDDACPQLAGPKESQGCPDSDGDGLADNKDKCPPDPEDKDNFQDEDGCPELDNDSDKIADKDDICPDEAENYNGVKDSDGCPDPDKPGTTVVVVVPKPTPVATNAEILYYLPSKSSLTKENKQKLDGIFAALQADPSKKARIEGHADDTGPAGDNMALSKDRAKESYKYLIKKGISKDRLSYEGFGETKPLEAKKDRNSRSKNRRVEIYVE